jgi:hypothetical protein
MLATSISACSEPDLAMTHFRCDADHACPDGQLCGVDSVCGDTAVASGSYAILLQADHTVSLRFVSSDQGAYLEDQVGDLAMAQAWLLQALDAPATQFQLIAASGMCLDLQSRDIFDGNGLQQYACDAGDVTQAFRLLPIGASFQIQSTFSDKCVDDGSNVETGRAAVQWNCTSLVNQTWDLVAAP